MATLKVNLPSGANIPTAPRFLALSTANAPVTHADEIPRLPNRNLNLYPRIAKASHPALHRMTVDYGAAYRQGAVSKIYPKAAWQARQDYLEVATPLLGAEEARGRELGYALALSHCRTSKSQLMRRIDASHHLPAVEKMGCQAFLLQYDRKDPNAGFFQENLWAFQRRCHEVLFSGCLDYLDFMGITKKYLRLVASTNPNGRLPYVRVPRTFSELAIAMLKRLFRRADPLADLSLEIRSFPWGFYAPNFAEVVPEAVPYYFRGWGLGDHWVTLYGANEYLRAFDRNPEDRTQGSEVFSRHDYEHGQANIDRLRQTADPEHTKLSLFPRGLREYLAPARTLGERMLRTQTWMGQRRLAFESSIRRYSADDAQLAEGVWDYFARGNSLLEFGRYAVTLLSSYGYPPSQFHNLREHLRRNGIKRLGSEVHEALRHHGELLGLPRDSRSLEKYLAWD